LRPISDIHTASNCNRDIAVAGWNNANHHRDRKLYSHHYVYRHSYSNRDSDKSPLSDEHAYPTIHTIPNAHAHSYVDTSSNHPLNCDAHQHPFPYPNTPSRIDSNINRSAYVHSNENTNKDAVGDTNPNTNPNTNSNSNTDAHCHPTKNAITNPDTISAIRSATAPLIP
jgi:hypothetical protein